MGKCRGTMQYMQVSGCGSGLAFCQRLLNQCYIMYKVFREVGLQNPFQRHSLTVTMKCTLV